MTRDEIYKKKAKESFEQMAKNRYVSQKPYSRSNTD